MKNLNNHSEAVNPSCLNCGEYIDSPFCPYCGQKNKDYRLSFKELFSDFLEEFFDLDSRAIKSLRLLFTKPGELTREYMQGRRIGYLSPVRLYLVASVLFFLLLSLKAALPGMRYNELMDKLNNPENTGSTPEKVLEEKLTPVPQDTLEPRESRLTLARSDTSGTNVSIKLGTNNYNLDQSDFLADFMDNFAKVMFLLLPVAAFQLKILYFRRKKLYLEHLIFSLHVHAFIFSLLIVSVILDYTWVMRGIIIISLIYLYLAMKRFYGQSHPKTISKMILLLASYGMATTLVMVFTMLVTAVGLLLSR